MRSSDGKLCFNKKETGKVWKDHMDRFTKEENYWDISVEVDAVEGTVVCAHGEEVLHVIMK